MRQSVAEFDAPPSDTSKHANDDDEYVALRRNGHG